MNCLNKLLQRVHNLFGCHLGGGLRKSALQQLMLRDFGCQPLVQCWLLAAVGLYNCSQQPPQCLPDVASGHSRKLALGSNVGSD